MQDMIIFSYWSRMHLKFRMGLKAVLLGYDGDPVKICILDARYRLVRFELLRIYEKCGSVCKVVFWLFISLFMLWIDHSRQFLLNSIIFGHPECIGGSYLPNQFFSFFSNFLNSDGIYSCHSLKTFEAKSGIIRDLIRGVLQIFIKFAF